MQSFPDTYSLKKNVETVLIFSLSSTPKYPCAIFLSIAKKFSFWLEIKKLNFYSSFQSSKLCPMSTQLYRGPSQQHNFLSGTWGDLVGLFNFESIHVFIATGCKLKRSNYIEHLKCQRYFEPLLLILCQLWTHIWQNVFVFNLAEAVE